MLRYHRGILDATIGLQGCRDVWTLSTSGRNCRHFLTFVKDRRVRTKRRDALLTISVCILLVTQPGSVFRKALHGG